MFSLFFFFSSRRRHTRSKRDWSSDVCSSDLVELAWRDGPRWVSRLIRRAVTKSGRKLVAEAGDAGLPVIEAEARQAERWLAAAEAANYDVIARNPVARQLGWQ